LPLAEQTHHGFAGVSLKRISLAAFIMLQKCNCYHEDSKNELVKTLPVIATLVLTEKNEHRRI
jgi:hypothetical protein